MWLYLLFVIIGVILVLWGADRLTDGAVALAERMNIPQIVIGLTIVAMGTSLPELSVSVTSAMAGSNELAVSNVIGSNIFNLMVVLGISAMLSPLFVSKSVLKRDYPFSVACAILLLVTGFISPHVLRIPE